MFDDTINFIQSTFNTTEFIPLHEPKFVGNEKKYLNECIDSTFVSSVGRFVDTFEAKMVEYTGAKYAIATVNGTSALHISLLLAGVEAGDEVITQPLTFIATCNAINYCNATPVFVDVDKDTMGLSPDALGAFLEVNCNVQEGRCINQTTGKVIRACVPMHTFGHPCKIDEIKVICDKFSVALVEDAAESLGSYYKEKHTGTFGLVGAFSFNGNKIITSGGGGCIVTNDESLAKKAKHMTTTAKIPHRWDFSHDMIGYNYRMPNLNASLLVAQLESLNNFLLNKQELAKMYKVFFLQQGVHFFCEPKNSKSNYWLNTLILADKDERDLFLESTNVGGVMTRPIWKLMNRLELFKDAQCGDLINSEWLEERVVNIPSSVRV
jgi:perosamine synthetase